MNSRLRLRAYLTFFLLAFSVYLLVPSLFDFRSLREDAETKGESVPWYVSLFPDKQINLGLDLRGGIYLELEVGLEEALRQRSELTAGEIERFLKEEKIPFHRVRVLPKTAWIEIGLQNEQDLAKLKGHLKDFYGQTFQEMGDSPLLQVTPISGESTQEIFEAVRSWAQDRQDVADVQLQSSGVELVMTDRADSKALQDSLQDKLGGGRKVSLVQGPLFLTQSEAYEAKLKDETVNQAVTTIRNRIDRHGVAEPNIQKLGTNRVMIELPGVRDPERAISLVKRAGKLEFKLVDDTTSDAKVAQWVQEARKENKIPEGYSVEVTEKINEALKGKIPAETEIAFEIQYDPVTKKIVGGLPYLLKRRVEVSGNMLKNAQVSVHNNEPYVSLSFDPAGTQAFADLTAANVGKRLAILLDGNVNKAPVIKGPIPGGEAQITLGFGDYQALVREAEDLVVVLREGALPATLKEATKTVIGPSLGKSSIQKGFRATLLAGTVVMIFMALWYKGAGLLADFALLANVLFIFAALSLFGATLTLPGIAGIVLTMGMAVDANIIITERIKEEIFFGKGVKAAVEAGYGNAMSSIVDANLTTFLSGLVLYQFGTGPIRGFAVTLMVGIVTTMFSAVVMTRIYYDWRLSKNKNPRLSL